MKVKRDSSLSQREHRCNAVRFLARRYLEVNDWTGYLRGYRIGNRFDSKWHTALQDFCQGLVFQLRAMLVEMAGYNFVMDIDSHSLSDHPDRIIEEALARAKLKKGGEGGEQAE